MAILSLSTLTNCFYIPSFIPAGSIALFEQSTCAPTSWVKDTTHNNKALRVVNSTITNGGATTFSSVLSPSKSLGVQATSTLVGGFSVSSASAAVSIDSTTFTINVQGALGNMPPHTHPYTKNNEASRTLGPGFTRQGFFDQNTSTSGSSQQHQHSVPSFSSNHNHTTPGLPHTHTMGEEFPHGHSISIPAYNFGVLYLDVIFATKS
jgi:hypothetical protein